METKNIKEYLLDCKPGKMIWLLNYTPGDLIFIMPVQFIGLTSHNKVITTGKWCDGYSSHMQDDSCKFRTALRVEEHNLCDVYASLYEAAYDLVVRLSASFQGNRNTIFKALSMSDDVKIPECKHIQEFFSEVTVLYEHHITRMLAEDFFCGVHERMKSGELP